MSKKLMIVAVSFLLIVHSESLWAVKSRKPPGLGHQMLRDLAHALGGQASQTALAIPRPAPVSLPLPEENLCRDDNEASASSQPSSSSSSANSEPTKTRFGLSPSRTYRSS